MGGLRQRRLTPRPTLRAELPHKGGGSTRRIGEFRHRDPVGQLQRRLETFRQTRRDIPLYNNAVHDDVDVVLEFLVERGRVGDVVILPVDLQPLETALLVFRDLLAVLALAAAHDRREQIEPCTLRQREDAIDHLADGLALDRQAGRRRIGNADARPQKPHVIVDLGDRADRRTRVLRGRLLLDGNRRRQAVDLVDVRLAHHFEELPRIGRQALDIAPLALGIDRVEGERRLAGAGQAREDDQRVARNGQIDVLEIVLARAPHGNHPIVARRRTRPGQGQVERLRIGRGRGGGFAGAGHGHGMRG